MLGGDILQGDQISSTGEGLQETRKRKNICKLDTSPVFVEEVAQHSPEKKVQVDIEKKFDKEYPGWRNEETEATYTIPCTFVDKGKKNAKNGAAAERSLFNTLNRAKDVAPMDVYLRSMTRAAKYENGPCFVFHGQKYEETEIDFIRINMNGVTVFECKGITRAVQAQDRYDDACSQLNESIPKLGLDDDIPINSVVAFPLCKRTKIDHDGNTRTLFKEDCENPPSFNKWLNESYEKKYFSSKKLTFERYLEVVQQFLIRYHTGEKKPKNFSQFKRRVVSDPADCLERATKTFYYKEQAAVLHDESYQNFWIDGCAGSGKTFLLKERVQWLARRDGPLVRFVGGVPKKLILVVTYNIAINKEIKLALKDVEGLVRVQTFRALLCHILWPEEPSNGSKDADLIQQILSHPKILQKYFKKKNVLKYHHILIDEAQDLCGKWMSLFKNLLNKQPSSIWIFCDPYQVVRRETNMPGKAELCNFVKHHIPRVVRNTHGVFEAYQYYFEKTANESSRNFKPIVGHDVYGKTPEYIPAENEEEMKDKILQKLEELQEKKVSLLDIAIITQGNSNLPQSSASDVLKKFLKSNKIPYINAEGTNEEGTKEEGTKIRRSQDPLAVIVDTVQRFKGLEAKVLIFCIVGDWVPRDVDIYVGFSRAFCHLIVLGKSCTIADIQKKSKDQE